MKYACIDRLRSDYPVAALCRVLEVSRCGWPRIYAQLRAHGVRVGKERVRCLIQRHGIVGRARRRYKATTNSKAASIAARTSSGCCKATASAAP